MSDFRWVVCELSDSEYESISPSFKKVVEAKKLTEKQDRIISLSESEPELLVPKYIPNELLPKKYDKNIYKDGIVEAENLQVFSSVVGLNDIDSILFELPLSEDTAIKHSSFEEYPFAILSYSLGLQVVAKIPGVYGNIMIPFGELKNSLSIVNSAMDQRTSSTMSKARKIYSCCSFGEETTQFDDEINEIFSFLPSALEEAIQRKVNVIFLSFWMG